MKTKKGRITIILIIIIILVILGGWFFLSHNSTDVESNEPAKTSTKNKKVANKNNLKLEKVTADKKLLLAVIVKYAMTQENNQQLQHFSLKDDIQFVETKENDHTIRYDIENNKNIAYITVIPTEDNKDRVVFWNADNKQITSVTLTGIIKLVNQKVSEQTLDKIVKKISVQPDEQESSSSSSSQQAKDTSSTDNLVESDLDSFLSNSTAMRALLYFAENNPKADGFWKAASDITTPLYITPNAMGNGFDVGADMGGRGSIAVSTQAMQDGSNEFSIKTNGSLPDSSSQYVATRQEVMNFINDAGGKPVISGIQYQIQSYDPSSVADDDEDYDEDLD